MAAEDTVTKGSVKLFGQSMSKKTLMIAGLVGAGVLGYAYYRRSKTSATDPAANIDPATGFPYGSADDTAALAQDSGLNTNQSGLIDPATGIPYADEAGGGGATGTGTTTVSTGNAVWEQQAIANLEAGGVAQSVISAAESGLPRYLAKLSLSSAQATAVQMAVGLTGPPPDGGPFTIIKAPGPGAGHKKPAAPHGLHVTHLTDRDATVGWSKVTGATSYQVQRSGHGTDNVGDVTGHTFGDLSPGTHYTYKVWAKNSAGTGPAASGAFRTHAKTHTGPIRK